MENYIAYGLEIESVFTLPELRPGQSDGEPDIVIESASLTPVDTEADADGERQVDVGPDRCRISYDGVGTFLVENGDRILVDPLSPEIPSTKVFRRLLEGQILGVCCHQRDLLVLHGSAVQIDGGAVVFLGPTGAGKSTTAAAFYGEGYPLLDDDIVVIETDGEQPTVAPGVPQLKLTPEMSDRFDIDATHVDDSQDVTEKTHYRTEPVDVGQSGVPLAACYILREGPTVSVEPVTGRDALFDLVVNTYTSGLLDETERTATNFRHCSRVTTAASVNLLSRPTDIGKLPELIEVVSEERADGANERQSISEVE